MEPIDRARALPSVATLIRYHVGVIVVSVGLALGLAALYVSNQPSSYTATAVVLLSPAPGNPLTAETASSSAVQMTVALETETQLVRTAAVLELVSGVVGRSVPGPGERLEVSVPSNTQMLKLDFTSSTPEGAREGAQAFAEGYLDYREERARAVQESRVASLKEQIANTEESLRQAVDDAGNSPYATQQVQLFADRLANLNNSLSAADLVSTHPGSVTSPAVPPEGSNELPGWIFLAAAAVFGLLLGAGLALLREWRRDLLRDADVGSELGVPVLATIRPQTEVSLGVDAGPGVHESYRQLRTAVIANAPRPYILAVTGVGGGKEPGSISAQVAANLAVVLAEAKLSVLLIATDSRDHGVEQLFGVTSEVGLSSVVLGGAAVHDSLIRTHGIALLPAGPDVEGASDLTATSSFGAVVEDLHHEFDYVIVAAASAGSADGDAVLLVAESTLLVLAPNTTTRTLLSATLDRLQRLGVKTIGAARVSPGRQRSSVRGTPGKRGSASRAPKVTDGAIGESTRAVDLPTHTVTTTQ